MVTVQHGASKVLEPVRRRLESNRDLLRHGPSAVLYGICDAVVDDYEKIADDLEQELEKLEAQVFASEGGADAARIYSLKRQVVEFRHAVGPLGHPMRVLTGARLTGIHPDMEPYFRDVADHLVRIAEQTEGLDSLLSSALGAHLTRVSVQQNDDLRRISAWVAIAAVPTMIAAVYGMNFENMPELHWRYGYFMVLGVMAVACTLLYRFFRRVGWL